MPVLLPHVAELLHSHGHSPRLVRVGEGRAWPGAAGASGKALASQLVSPLENADNATRQGWREDENRIRWRECSVKAHVLGKRRGSLCLCGGT